jgi:hypothetical protein
MVQSQLSKVAQERKARVDFIMRACGQACHRLSGGEKSNANWEAATSDQPCGAAIERQRWCREALKCIFESKRRMNPWIDGKKGIKHGQEP